MLIHNITQRSSNPSSTCFVLFFFACGLSPEQITKALLGIQDSFEAQIEKLRNLDYTVLDVTTSRWHDDYNSFKDVVKDLEASANTREIDITRSSTLSTELRNKSGSPVVIDATFKFDDVEHSFGREIKPARTGGER